MAEGRPIGAAIAREIKDIERKKSKSIRKDDFSEVSKLCNIAGELLSTNGFFAEAIQWHEEEVKYSEVANDILGVAIGNRKIGECLCELSKFEEAIEHQKQHLKLAQSIANDVEEQRALATLGRTLFVMSDSMETEFEQKKCLKESLHYYLKSFSVSNKLREQVSSKEIHEMRARLCLNIGLVYEWKNELDQAEKYMEKALISSRENGLKDNMYRCYLSLSGVTAKNKKYEEALRLAKRAQHLAKEKADKSMEADAVLQLGQIFMKLGSFSSAVKLIRQSYKLHVPTLENDKESLIENLKLAIKGERYSQQLVLDLEDEEKLKLVEKLGDVFSEAKSSEKALFYYQKQLELCEKLEKGSRAIGTVCISLAITYAENGDVEKALEFYRKELKLREEAGLDSDFKEISATYSAVAKLLEDSNADGQSVIEAYSKAVEYAEKSRNASCVLRVCRELSQTLKTYDNSDELLAINKKIKFLEETCDDVEEDSHISKEENEEEIDDIEELLHASDSSEEEAKTVKHARTARKKANKVNEKGETPLHVACIGGDIAKAKDLLERGASVHNRDFCGWQPLHEACNFGHTEIAKLLLLFGADVNDAGGDHCGNVTPLHDASQNGHIETVKLLISRGANPLAKDAKGRSPLDLVQAAIEADEEELEGSESDVLENRRKVRAYLRQTVLKSRPEPHLRSRNVLDQPAHSGVNSSEDESENRSSRNVNAAGNTSSDEEDFGSRIIDRRSKNAANLQIEDDSESCPAVGFGIYSQTQNLDQVVVTANEACYRDEDSTYESMDEGVSYVHSPIKPLETLENKGTQLEQSIQRSSSMKHPPHGATVQSAASDNQSFVVVDRQVQAQIDDEYSPGAELVNAFSSESDSSDAETVDGFIVDDIGHKQARKKRRLEGFPRKRTIQQKITIPGQSPSSFHAKRRVSERGSSSSSRVSRSKKKLQSKLTSFHAGTNFSPAGKSVSRSQPTQSRDQLGHRNCYATNHGRSNLVTDQSFDETVRDIAFGQGAGVQSSRAPKALVARGAIRVRVRVENELLLIPCIDDDERRTVKWLADQASQRYCSSTGLTPSLYLKTKEGALLSNQDFVTDVLINNEEVTAQITGWISGSICEKYETECAVLGIDARAEVIDVLKLENELCNLNLADFSLKNSHLTAISRSVAGHTKLTKIDLTGNLLGDSGIGCLCGSIRYLPSLVSLNLLCTGMTSVGLSYISKCFSSGMDFRIRTVTSYDPGPPLEDLDCSYNSLDDPLSVVKSLASILRTCTRLSSLVLDHCFLPKDLFSPQHNFSMALKESNNLVSLSLSGNHLQTMTDVFCLIPETLQELNVSLCFPVRDSLQSNVDDVNLKQLKSLGLQGLPETEILNCVLMNDSLAKSLQTLDVSNSSADRESIVRLLRTISRLEALKELNLSCTEAIDGSVACQLIENLESSSSTLSVLNMTSCNILSLSDVFIQSCFNCQSLSHVDLSFNKLPMNDKQRLAETWHERFKFATSFVDEIYCIVSVKSNKIF